MHAKIRVPVTTAVLGGEAEVPISAASRCASLLRAVRVVRHLRVVLREIGRRVAQVEHIAALAQRREQRGSCELRRRLPAWAETCAAKTAQANAKANRRTNPLGLFPTMSSLPLQARPVLPPLLRRYLELVEQSRSSPSRGVHSSR